MTNKLTKLYMTGVAGIYLMFAISGGSLLAVIFCEWYGLDYTLIAAITGLLIISILFFVYLTLLKYRLYDMQYERTIVPDEDKLKEMIESSIDDEANFENLSSNISELDDDDNI